MPKPLVRTALGTAIAILAWLVLNLVVYMLVLSFLGPLGMAVRGDEPVPMWFKVMAWCLQVALVALAIAAGWRWAWRLIPADKASGVDSRSVDR